MMPPPGKEGNFLILRGGLKIKVNMRNSLKLMEMRKGY
jgi:hypothetical protein